MEISGAEHMDTAIALIGFVLLGLTWLALRDMGHNGGRRRKPR